MPQLAIGTMIAGWLGGSAIAITIGAAVQGAIIGAAIGGLTAAVTGGDIGKGLLFGAVGGAITGGLTEYFTGGIENQLAGTARAQATLAESASQTGAYDRMVGTSAEFTMADNIQPSVFTGTDAVNGASITGVTSAKDLTLAQVLQQQGKDQMVGGILSGGAKGLGEMYSAGKAADTAKETQALNAATQITINEKAAEDALARQRLVGEQQREQQDIGIEEAKRKQAVDVSFQKEALMQPYLQKEEERRRRASILSSLTTQQQPTSFLATVNP